MCLYPRLIQNKKYRANAKNGGNVPKIKDQRTRFVPIGCGKCMECRKQKAREWQIRLQEDIKTNKNGKFVTLTFSNESIKHLNNIIEKEEAKGTEIKTEGYERDNKIATKAVRLWLERWRKEYKTSIKHWLVTELGGNGTENIHLHGIIWTNEKLETVEKKWQYGWMWKGKMVKGKLVNYVNEQTVNYIIKYVNKIDEKHKTYKPKILTSKGIGKNYINTINANHNKYNGSETNETYRTRTGYKMALPIYYRNKLYNEEEKEKLWLEKLNKETRYINGQKITIKDGEQEYYKALKEAQQLNKELGYGNDKKNWQVNEYENERREMLRKKRIEQNGEVGGDNPPTPTRRL